MTSDLGAIVSNTPLMCVSMAGLQFVTSDTQLPLPATSDLMFSIYQTAHGESFTRHNYPVLHSRYCVHKNILHYLLCRRLHLLNNSSSLLRNCTHFLRKIYPRNSKSYKHTSLPSIGAGYATQYHTFNVYGSGEMDTRLTGNSACHCAIETHM